MKVIACKDWSLVFGGDLASVTDDLFNDGDALEAALQQINWTNVAINTSIITAVSCIAAGVLTRHWGHTLAIGALAASTSFMTSALIPNFSLATEVQDL